MLELSYDRFLRQFGPPLEEIARPGGERCLYYAVAGQKTGWLFCFSGTTMVSAAGNQKSPGDRQ